MDKKRGLVAAIVLYVTVITVLSLVKISPDIQPDNMPMLDKVVHFGFYFILNALLMLWVLINRFPTRFRPMVITTLVAVAYSVMIEFLQQYTGRDFDLYDIAANSAGAVASLLFFKCGTSRAYIKKVLGI